MLASMLDQPPHLPIQSVRITGEQDYPPMDLLAAWLTLRLNVPVTMEIEPNAQAITGVYLTRKDGELSLERRPSEEGIARISVPGQSPQAMPLPIRSMIDCMSEELGRLYPDEIYAEVLTKGWQKIHPSIR